MKALKTAAIIVGAVALVASGAEALGGIAAIGLTATTATTIGIVAGAASGVLSFASAAAMPKGTIGGNATKFKIDRESGIPVVLGRTFPFGWLIPARVSP